MRKSLKQLLVMTLIMITALAAVPVQTQAAAKTPAKIARALERAVDENGRAIIIDQSAERLYLFKRNCKGEWIMKKSGRCIVSQKICKTKHYVLMRDDDYDTLLWGTEDERWSYGMIIDCYEKPATIVIHSYTERYTGRTWVKDKSRTGNDFGVAVCEELARYIWKYYGDGTAVMGV